MEVLDNDEEEAVPVIVPGSAVIFEIDSVRARQLSQREGSKVLLRFGGEDFGAWRIEEVWRDDKLETWFVRYRHSRQEMVDF